MINSKKRLEYNKQWRKDNPDRVRDNHRNWYKNNPEKWSNYQKMYRKSRKQIVFDHYGWECKCCGETIPQFLTIDHINNDGYKDKRINKTTSGDVVYRNIIKNNFPDTFQVLCFNCNCGKNVNKGICPHKSKELGTRLKTLENKVK